MIVLYQTNYRSPNAELFVFKTQCDNKILVYEFEIGEKKYLVLY
jgi:hypothetical protein